ncbi:MAG: methylated-DNA--[protein]-cysteine S-methyltransferase [Labilithrix sp.]|nr:methylated-DNA--[protein]-cysteine S-methyltransferase [Labilithrix sp.]MCW5812169.1 methylated-DNA--[protein]-cysteine S-methyltransferase [Labilithrix sp.]
MARCHFVMPSPIGALTLRWENDALTAVLFGVVPDDSPHDDAPLLEARRQLDAYFAGTRARFDLPLAPRGTPFQLRVWRALRAIPYGETTSYGALARKIGDTGPRAVGAANGRNPIPVIVPCHRVIGADGSLTGFGGGLPTKRWLLDHEAHPSKQSPAPPLRGLRGSGGVEARAQRVRRNPRRGELERGSAPLGLRAPRRPA